MINSSTLTMSAGMPATNSTSEPTSITPVATDDLSDCMTRRLLRFKDYIASGIAKGHTGYEIAMETGLAEPTVRRYAQLLGLHLPRKKRKRPDEDVARIQEIVEMRKSGKTLDEVGKVFGITRERVRQIVRKHAPDVVIGGKKTTTECAVCGIHFIAKGHRPGIFCSHNCWSAARQIKSGWNRDLAEKIIKLRGQGDTWQQVSDKLGYPRVDVFRSNLQRHISILFSTQEQQHIFPTYFKRHEDVRA